MDWADKAAGAAERARTADQAEHVGDYHPIKYRQDPDPDWEVTDKDYPLVPTLEDFGKTILVPKSVMRRVARYRHQLDRLSRVYIDVWNQYPLNADKLMRVSKLRDNLRLSMSYEAETYLR